MCAKRAHEAEDIGKKQKVARQKFRGIIRKVALNRIWLVDMTEQKLSLNVKKNIAMLVRQQRKVGILTLAEKSLIRKHHSLRTIEERKKLVTLLAGLTCFSRIPPKVRARLVPIIAFMVLNKGRILISEGYPSSTIYFILSGEVEVTKKVFDRIKNSYVDKVEFIYGSGDCVGDVELLENCDRINTITTTTEVELLVIHSDDFNRILRPIMSTQWMDKKKAINGLNYFNFLTPEQVVVACKLGVLRQFEPLETIYFEDKGPVSYVHFVISGECMILQCLKIKVRQTRGRKTFELIDISKMDADSMFHTSNKSQLMEKAKKTSLLPSSVIFDMDSDIESFDDDQSGQSKGNVYQPTNIKSYEVTCAQQISGGEEGVDQRKKSKTRFSEVDTSLDYDYGEAEDYKFETISDIEISDSKDKDVIGSGENIRNEINESNSYSNSSQEFFSEGTEKEDIPTPNKFGKLGEKPETNIEDHFIDVGSYTFGGIFGLGESLEHRVIMARTTVQCLMLPRFWLFEKDQNPGNIWQRRRFYLDSTVPSRNSLFQDFLRTRKWQKFKKDFIESSLDPNSRAISTKIEDIPIICRIVEATDD